MKISQMTQREEFYKILVKTMNSFFPNSEFRQVENKSGNYHVYENLNAIMPRNSAVEAVNFIKDEFTYPSGIKNKLSYAYIDMKFSFPHLFSDKSYIWEEPEFSNNSTIIFPSNRKLRIMDFSRNTAFVCMKDGFPGYMISKEIEFRTKHTDNFILPIEKYGDRYYIENILQGKSLARIKSREKKKLLIDKALQTMGQFASDTIEEVNLKQYSKKLVETIDNKLKNNNQYNNIKKLAQYLSSAVSNGSKDLLSFTHGDFQEGNIWINESDNIIIIDWETYSKRLAVYDKFVLFSGIRNCPNYINALTNLRKLDYNIARKETDINDLLRIFVLEDIKWMLEERESLPPEYESISLRNFNKEDKIQSIRGML